MDDTEMVQILEEIIRDPDTNPTARCTAIPNAGRGPVRLQSQGLCESVTRQESSGGNEGE
jgi:hypothetical protein